MTELLAIDRRQALDGVASSASATPCRPMRRCPPHSRRSRSPTTRPAPSSPSSSTPSAPRPSSRSRRGRPRPARLCAPQPRHRRPGPSRTAGQGSSPGARNAAATGGITRVRLIRRRGLGSPGPFLDTLWDEITVRDCRAQLLPATIDPRRGGPARRLAHGRVEFTGAEGAEGPWRCDTCRTLAWFMVADVCPTYQCRGTIRPVQAGRTAATTPRCTSPTSSSR